MKFQFDQIYNKINKTISSPLSSIITRHEYISEVLKVFASFGFENARYWELIETSSTKERFVILSNFVGADAEIYTRGMKVEFNNTTLGMAGSIIEPIVLKD